MIIIIILQNCNQINLLNIMISIIIVVIIYCKLLKIQNYLSIEFFFFYFILLIAFSISLHHFAFPFDKLSITECLSYFKIEIRKILKNIYI